MAEQQESLEARLEKARNDKLSREALSELSDALADAGRFREAYEVSEKEKQAWKTAEEQGKVAAEQETAALRQDNKNLRQDNKNLRQDNKNLRQENKNLRQDNNDKRYGAFIKDVHFRNGAARLPELSLNSSVHPSIEGHRLKGMGSQEAQYISKNFPLIIC